MLELSKQKNKGSSPGTPGHGGKHTGPVGGERDSGEAAGKTVFRDHF